MIIKDREELLVFQAKGNLWKSKRTMKIQIIMN